MAGVNFINVKEFAKTATRVIIEIETSGKSMAITKYGKPILILSRATGKERGQSQTVSILKNKASHVISEVAETGKRLIITRDEKPVAILSKVTNNAFRTGE